MADAPPLPSPPPAPAGDVGPSTSSPPASVPRALPPTLLLVPPPPSSSGRSRGARGGSAVGGGGKRKADAQPPDSGGARGRRIDRLAEAVRVVGRDVETGVAGADILELAMAKGPMFAWLSYWPEEGFSKEDHPY
ncbi:translation initiation factor IF-2-like [Panicum miliaceum]|uniref:Translation initiation factor IF-2-like n=1 Tax=Panicum miliaceum TaxID=4540 RepID=A0A3L6TJ60_PANMI|nr:translation initiation factor IF-2-like [Panicum miliaceum]